MQRAAPLFWQLLRMLQQNLLSRSRLSLRTNLTPFNTRLSALCTQHINALLFHIRWMDSASLCRRKRTEVFSVVFFLRHFSPTAPPKIALCSQLSSVAQHKRKFFPALRRKFSARQTANCKVFSASAAIRFSRD